MDDIEARIDALLHRLDWLRRADPERDVFGADDHDHQPGAPLDEATISAFETANGIRLPDSYRAYLRLVGNGGAGPYYGLNPLGDTSFPPIPVNGDDEADAATDTDDLPEPAVNRPFPLDGPWDPTGPDTLPTGASPHDGCVLLAHQGCGYFDLLVVNGPRAGEVWTDNTVASLPIEPAHVDFLDWYEAWLDRAQIQWVELNAEPMARFATPHPPGIDDAVDLVDRALDRDPAWADGWRARGYVHLSRGDGDAARRAFETAAACGTDEPDARLHLDLSRLAAMTENWTTALDHTGRGLECTDIWVVTRNDLRVQTVLALDGLGRDDDALDVLAELASDAYFTLDHHYELATRRLRRSEPDLAWETLDQAVTGDIGPDRYRTPASGESVYQGLIAHLDDSGETGLGDLVRARLAARSAASPG